MAFSTFVYNAEENTESASSEAHTVAINMEC